MDADDLFLATLEDLDARSSPGKAEYEVLQIAALLRKLLLDEARLTDQVNASRRLKIRYYANNRNPPSDPAPTFWSMQDGLDPDTAAPLARNNPQQMTRDQFLAVTVILTEGVALTVRDVIDYLANVAGAVHLGRARTPEHAVLAALDRDIQVGGYSPTVRSLLAIARVTVRALQPLRSDVVGP
jgi:hypothetical protein